MKIRISKGVALAALTASTAILLTAGQAQATNGYFVYGFGPTSKGMAGAGVATSEDALIAATNPAGMANVGKRFDVDVTFFSPDRDYDVKTGGTGLGTAEKTSSRNKLFLLPNMGVNYPIDDQSSVGFTMNAAGGMNTEYNKNVFGGFGAGSTPTGVDLAQMFTGITYARKIGANHSVGITPTLAVQRFKAYGLEAFTGISTAGTKVTGNGYDWSYGYGVRVGW